VLKLSRILITLGGVYFGPGGETGRRKGLDSQFEHPSGKPLA
jgi:hypothetical protein